MYIVYEQTHPIFKHETFDTDNILIHSISLAEIVMGFLRATDEEKILKIIIRNYLKCKFWIDVLALFNLHDFLLVLVLIKLVRIRVVIRWTRLIKKLIKLVTWNIPKGLAREHSNFLTGKVIGDFSSVILIGFVGLFLLGILVVSMNFQFNNKKIRTVIENQQKPGYWDIFFN